MIDLDERFLRMLLTTPEAVTQRNLAIARDSWEEMDRGQSDAELLDYLRRYFYTDDNPPAHERARIEHFWGMGVLPLLETIAARTGETWPFHD